VVDLLVVVEQIYLFLLSFINVLEHCAVKGIDAEATTAKLLFFRLPFFIAQCSGSLTNLQYLI